MRRKKPPVRGRGQEVVTWFLLGASTIGILAVFSQEFNCAAAPFSPVFLPPPPPCDLPPADTGIANWLFSAGAWTPLADAPEIDDPSYTGFREVLTLPPRPHLHRGPSVVVYAAPEGSGYSHAADWQPCDGCVVQVWFRHEADLTDWLGTRVAPLVMAWAWLGRIEEEKSAPSRRKGGRRA